jgi:hypothetical protein
MVPLSFFVSRPRLRIYDDGFCGTPPLSRYFVLRDGEGSIEERSGTLVTVAPLWSLISTRRQYTV